MIRRYSSERLNGVNTGPKATPFLSSRIEKPAGIVPRRLFVSFDIGRKQKEYYYTPIYFFIVRGSVLYFKHEEKV